MKQKRTLCGAVFLFLMAISTKTSSQYFSKTYLKDRQTMVFENVVTNQDTAYILGLTIKLQSIGYNDRILLGKIPLQMPDSFSYFTLIDTQQADYAAWYYSLSRDKINGGYSATGYSFAGKKAVLIVSLDESFNPLQISEIYDTDTTTLSYKGFNILRFDSFYMISGIIQHPNQEGNILLLKTDLEGNVLLKKEYGTSGYWDESARSMIKLNNKNILIGSYRSYENRPYAVSQTWLLEVDTLGAIKRQWFDSNDSTYGAYSLRATKDGGYIYAAQKAYRQTINSAYLYATVVKMDSVFNKQWTFIGGKVSLSTGIFDIEELEDGSFIACGNTRFAFPPDSTVQSGWIIKLSPSGDLLWERYYEVFSNFGASNYLHDIELLPDGGFIACGEANGDDGQYGWLLKVDSNGCVIENCLVAIDEVAKPTVDLKLKIYPNPAQTEITVDYSFIDWSQQEELSLVLMNNLGQIFYQERLPQYSGLQRVDVSPYPVGIYTAYIKRNRSIVAVAKFAKQ